VWPTDCPRGGIGAAYGRAHAPGPGPRPGIGRVRSTSRCRDAHKEVVRRLRHPGRHGHVAYAARIGLGPASFPYQAILTGRRGEPLEQRWRMSYRGVQDPEGGTAEWRWPRLAFSATWSATASGIDNVLLHRPDLGIVWRCHFPRADVRGRLDGAPFEGVGYLEELLVDGNPTAVPIRELRWGRFLSARDWLVWIDWRGAHPLTLVYHNGALIADASVTDTAVSLPDGRLALDGTERWTLREERAGASTFPNRRWLRSALPRTLADLREHKWAAPGCFIDQEGSRSLGWTVFERVTWP